jgi:hypothetical protein
LVDVSAVGWERRVEVGNHLIGVVGRFLTRFVVEALVEVGYLRGAPGPAVFPEDEMGHRSARHTGEPRAAWSCAGDRPVVGQVMVLLEITRSAAGT